MKTFSNQVELTEEIWEKSPLSIDTLEVSNKGRVRRLPITTISIREGKTNIQKRKQKSITPWKGNNGYFYISVSHEGKSKKYTLHRLIASYFVEGFHPELTVNHINGIKTDNRIENLEWVTLEKNTELQWKTGLITRGENYKFSKLKDLEVLDIKKSKVKVSELAVKYNVSESIIYKIKQGIRRKYLNENI